MNSNTALIMLAVIAAFGLATATLVVPLLPQAHATVITKKDCHNFFDRQNIGECARNAPIPGPGGPP